MDSVWEKDGEGGEEEDGEGDRQKSTQLEKYVRQRRVISLAEQVH